MRGKVFVTWIVAVCLTLVAAAVHAQVPTGTIAGRVTDQNGLVVPGATVTATSPNLQGSRIVVTSAFGDYAVSLLPPGDYTVIFELTGFQRVTRTVAVAPTQTVPLDISLMVGGVTETVTVIGNAAPFVQTATVATNYRQELLQTLPSSRTLGA